nr:MAG TPA: hypothetical protein [Caudoviricetes sp.]DAP20629.1 MAG TPA: hypothetical protein [Caudoviricetes sp.]DAP20669.1 MAG TPA: hypothetical protein [Caudoviricetes sp.]DAV35336.1 MAG TPA: hypothetical protein [Caudoviricetes sp.]
MENTGCLYFALLIQLMYGGGHHERNCYHENR